MYDDDDSSNEGKGLSVMYVLAVILAIIAVVSITVLLVATIMIGIACYEKNFSDLAVWWRVAVMSTLLGIIGLKGMRLLMKI
jgi:hypothetical protein